MLKLLTIGSLALALLLAGCASSGEPPEIRQRLLDMGLEAGENNSRIPSYRINGWQSLDDTNLIVTAGVNDRYLVRLSMPCFGLQGAFFIGFTTPAFGLDRFDSVVVRGPGGRRELCPIDDIIRLYPIDG